jgi:methylase of polypeptide subunit release factors
MDFVKQYNAATESQAGTIIPVEISIFEDRTFSFILKTPPAPVLLRQKAGLDKASSTPGKTVAGTVTEADIEAVALGALEWLAVGGWLVLEIGYQQGDAVRQLLIQAQLTDVEIRKDLTGRDRIAIARKP